MMVRAQGGGAGKAKKGVRVRAGAKNRAGRRQPAAIPENRLISGMLFPPPCGIIMVGGGGCPEGRQPRWAPKPGPHDDNEEDDFYDNEDGND